MKIQIYVYVSFDSDLHTPEIDADIEALLGKKGYTRTSSGFSFDTRDLEFSATGPLDQAGINALAQELGGITKTIAVSQDAWDDSDDPEPIEAFDLSAA